jgi:hypothetical protein
MKFELYYTNGRPVSIVHLHPLFSFFYTFITLSSLYGRSRVSSGSIVSDYGLDDRAIGQDGGRGSFL